MHLTPFWIPLPLSWQFTIESDGFYLNKLHLSTLPENSGIMEDCLGKPERTVFTNCLYHLQGVILTLRDWALWVNTPGIVPKHIPHYASAGLNSNCFLSEVTYLTKAILTPFVTLSHSPHSFTHASWYQPPVPPNHLLSCLSLKVCFEETKLRQVWNTDHGEAKSD